MRRGGAPRNPPGHASGDPVRALVNWKRTMRPGRSRIRRAWSAFEPPIRVARLGCGVPRRVPRWPGMDADDQLLRTGAFVECVFHCVECGLGGTSLIRPAAVREKVCLDCGG